MVICSTAAQSGPGGRMHGRLYNGWQADLQYIVASAGCFSRNWRIQQSIVIVRSLYWVALNVLRAVSWGCTGVGLFSWDRWVRAAGVNMSLWSMALLPLRLLFKNRQHFGRLYFLSDRNCKTFWGHSVISCYDAQRILAKILKEGYTISPRFHLHWHFKGNSDFGVRLRSLIGKAWL